MTQAKQPAEDEEEPEFDLLADISEDDGEPWMPRDKEDQPEMFQGKLVRVGTVWTDAFPGNPPMEVPIWTVQTRDGVRYSVRAYHKVLREEMQRSKAVEGDYVGLAYFGLKEARKGGTTYESYKVKAANPDGSPKR